MKIACVIIIEHKYQYYNSANYSVTFTFKFANSGFTYYNKNIGITSHACDQLHFALKIRNLPNALLMKF